MSLEIINGPIRVKYVKSLADNYQQLLQEGSTLTVSEYIRELDLTVEERARLRTLIKADSYFSNKKGPNNAA